MWCFCTKRFSRYSILCLYWTLTTQSQKTGMFKYCIYHWCFYFKCFLNCSLQFTSHYQALKCLFPYEILLNILFSIQFECIFFCNFPLFLILKSRIVFWKQLKIAKFFKNVKYHTPLTNFGLSLFAYTSTALVNYCLSLFILPHQKSDVRQGKIMLWIW